MNLRNKTAGILGLSLILAGAALGQQPSISFVNALPSSDPVEILYKGTPVRPFPFSAGDISSAFEVPPGSFSFSVKGYGESPVDFTVEVPESGKVIVVIFEKSISDKETGEIKKELAIAEVPGLVTSSGSMFRILVVGQPDALTVSLNGKPTSLKPEVVSPPQSSGQSFTIKIPSVEDVLSISVEDAGSYLVIVFPDHDGSLRHTLTNG